MFKRLLPGQDHLAADGWGGAEGEAGVGGGGSASSLAVGCLLCHCTFCHYRTATETAALVQASQAAPRLVRDLAAGTRSCRASGARTAGHSSVWRSLTGGRGGGGGEGGGRGEGGGTGRGLAELGLKISNPASASVDRKQLFDSLSVSSINNNLKPTFSAPPPPPPQPPSFPF